MEPIPQVPMDIQFHCLLRSTQDFPTALGIKLSS
jgi:hypothetical protein